MRYLIILIFTLTANFSFGQNELTETEKLELVTDYIKKETVGGKLDFALKMANDEKSFYAYDKIIYNRKDFAILLWGQYAKQNGITSSKKARELWEEIMNRKLTKPEKKALNRGFKLEI